MQDGNYSAIPNYWADHDVDFGELVLSSTKVGSLIWERKYCDIDQEIKPASCCLSDGYCGLVGPFLFDPGGPDLDGLEAYHKSTLFGAFCFL